MEIEHDEHGRVKLSSVPTNQALNVLCHKNDIEIINDRDDVMEITAEKTVAMTARFTERTWELAKQDADFKRRLGIVFPDIDITKDTRHIKHYPIGIRHVVGLIICTNMAINTGKTPFWRLPETNLHPSSCAKLTDLVMSYQNDAKEAAKDETP